MGTAQLPALDMDKLNAFVGRFVGDLGAAVHAGMVVIGEKLGLYKALAAGPMTAAELASRTDTDERYVREWLGSQAAGGYVTYDKTTDRFSLSPEQAFTMAQEDSPAYLPGAFELALGSLAAVPRIADSFRSGAGMGWHEHADGVFHGCEKFFRPGYAANLVSSWIPALAGVQQKLEAGARVADVGCGKGASTLLLARAFPNSKFFGFDYHDQSIAGAQATAAGEKLADRVSFAVSSAKDFPGRDYDLVAVFDCLHDMGDPVGAARHVLQSLHKDGTWMIVEPFANDEMSDNLNPVGRVYYSFSTLLTLSGSGTLSGRAGRRGTHPRSRHEGGLHPLPPGRRNAVQHRLRSPALVPATHPIRGRRSTWAKRYTSVHASCHACPLPLSPQRDLPPHHAVRNSLHDRRMRSHGRRQSGAGRLRYPAAGSS